MNIRLGSTGRNTSLTLSVVALISASSLVAACSSDDPPDTADAGAHDASATNQDSGTTELDGSTSSGPADASGGTGTPDSSTKADAGGASDSGSAWSATFTGSVGTTVPTVKDAIAFNKEGYLTIRFTDYAQACVLEDANDEHLAGSSYLQLYLDTYPGTIGTLPIGDTAGTTAQAIFWERDSVCSGTEVAATSGSVSISALDATHVTGSVSLVFGADTYGGTFTAEICGTGDPVGSGGACITP